MKSSFLFFLILGAFLATQASAQTKIKTKKIIKTTTVTTIAKAATPVAEAPKSSFDKFYERLSIGYFGAVTAPTLQNWNSDYAATSPETSGNCKNCDSYAFNLWSQVNFGYNFGAKFKFNIIPRFTVFFDSPKTQEPGERGNVLIEDALVGFSGVLYTSENKKFNWWMRPGIRLPTSHASRHYNNKDSKENGPGFGRLTYNLEITNSFTYDFDPKFQLGLSYQNRYWIFENRYNASRNRHYIAPNFTYTINETTKLIGYYENMLENNKRWKSINGKNPSYRNIWQNAYIGVGKDVTSKLNVYPYISAFVNDVPFSLRSFWIGAWISYTIK